MTKDDCFELGSVVKPHGLKGAVTAYFDADDPGVYQNIDAILIELHGNLVPHFITKVERKNVNQFILHFEGFTAEKEARAISKARLFLPLAALPKLEGKKFYYHELIGFNVEDEHYGSVGTVTSFNDQSANILMYVDHNGTEVLIPMTDDIYLDLNRETKTISTRIPIGLIEMYTEEHSQSDEE